MLIMPPQLESQLESDPELEFELNKRIYQKSGKEAGIASAVFG